MFMFWKWSTIAFLIQTAVFVSVFSFLAHVLPEGLPFSSVSNTSAALFCACFGIEFIPTRRRMPSYAVVATFIAPLALALAYEALGGPSTNIPLFIGALVLFALILAALFTAAGEVKENGPDREGGEVREPLREPRWVIFISGLPWGIGTVLGGPLCLVYHFMQRQAPVHG